MPKSSKASEKAPRALVVQPTKTGYERIDQGNGRDQLGRLMPGHSARGIRPGRKPGQVNKVTRSMKDKLQAWLDSLSQREFDNWANRNRAEAMKIAARLIPQQREVSGPGGAPIERRDVSEYSEAELLAILEAPAQGS